MFLKDIRVKNVRIFDKLEIEFNNDLNIIYGLNGQGKTSLLEAIHYLSLTKSFRVSKDSIVKRSESDFFEVTGNFIDQNDSVTNLRIYFSGTEGKHAFINSNKVKLFSELVGMFPLILLSLDDLELTYGVPAYRRKFLDVLLSQLYPGYLHNLRNYKQSVSQKNKLLNSDKTIDREELAVWNKQLVSYGSEVLQQRVKFIEFSKKYISLKYVDISKKNERIQIKYISTVPKINAESSIKEVKELFSQTLETSIMNEIRRNVSLIGPHKDDLDFLINDFPFKSHGSQGENKSFLLALKMVEADYIKEISKKRPLCLFDDIFGELDNKRINNLIDLIKNQGQTFITTTEINKFKNLELGNKKYFHLYDHAIH